MNIPKTRREAKQLYLKRLQSKMIDQFKQASKAERAAIFKHINSFLSAVSRDERIFWLKFRSKLERLNERFAVNSNETEIDFQGILSPLSFNLSQKFRRNNSEKISKQTKK